MRKLGSAPITELVDSGRLKSADILLEHSKGSLWGWLIRLGTCSYWNHALMVCSVSGSGNEDEKILVIDPRMGGIYTISLIEYFKKYGKYDVAVKRLEDDWFQNADRSNESEYQKMVSAYALRRVIDKSTVAVSLGPIRQFLRKLTIITRFIRQKIWISKRKFMQYTSKPLNLNTYACSGIIQWSYFRGVSRVTTREEFNNSKRQEVTFSPSLPEEAHDDDLLSITPADLARSNKLTWKYIVRNGFIWEVSNEEEIKSIIPTKITPQ